MESSSKPTKLKRRVRWLIVLGIVVALGAYSTWALSQPNVLIKPIAQIKVSNVQAPPVILTWPSSAQAAIGINENGVLASHGTLTPVPIASTAKLITALSVLQKFPLSVGQQGSTITLGASDVALYDNYVSQDGSVVPVVAGEQISEYQMLEAMLLPSANNMADSLAIWAFGSLADYASYANHYIVGLGLNSTHVGTDASGFDPSTTSTASDLVRLGESAMQNPVLAQIVGQSSASGIPETIVVTNVNSLLGNDGIIGIKTGNTAQAGGVFISASNASIGGHQVPVITAVAGAPSLYDALYGSLPLISSGQNDFSNLKAIKAGAVVGSYNIRWGKAVQAVAKTNLTVPVIDGSSVQATIHLLAINQKSHAGQVVGTITTSKSTFANAQSVNIVLQQTPSQPSVWWKLLHP